MGTLTCWQRFALFLAAAAVGLRAAPAAERQPDRPGGEYSFFAFDNGVGRGHWSPEKQAATLAALGYDGIGYSGVEELEERMDAFARHRIRIFNLYVGARLGPEGPTLAPGLVEALPKLKNRGIALWLFVTGKADDGEAQAIRIVGEIADLAAAQGVRVVLYPHTGFYVATLSDAMRVARATGRPNVGVTFNLCHFLKVEGESGWREAVVSALPLLEFVSINGADAGDTRTMGWERLIQPLGRGTFDVARVMSTLKELGYRGPVGLQCYNVMGDQEDNLRRSMIAWQEIASRLAGTAKQRP
jgi:sugar phosphate isomerase/epimerase